MKVAIIVLAVLLFASVAFNIIMACAIGMTYNNDKTLTETYKWVAKEQKILLDIYEKRLFDKEEDDKK